MIIQLLRSKILTVFSFQMHICLMSCLFQNQETSGEQNSLSVPIEHLMKLQLLMMSTSQTAMFKNKSKKMKNKMKKK